MNNLTLDKLFDLLLVDTPIGEKININLSITKKKEGGWNIEYLLPSPAYKIEPDEGDKDE